MTDDESQDSGSESAESDPQEPPKRSVWEPFVPVGEGDPDPNRRSEEEAFIDRGDDAPTDASAADDEDDLAAKRAALEAEIDRQLAALESVVVRDDEPAEDGSDEDGPADDEPAEERDELEDALEELRAGGGGRPAETEAADVEEPTDRDDVEADEPEADEEDGEGDAVADPDDHGGEDEGTTPIAPDDGAALATSPDKRRPWLPLAAVAVVAAVVIGIIVSTGGDDEPADRTAADATSTTVPVTLSGSDVPMSAEAAFDYFDAYGTQDPDVLERMLALAAPGSSAYAYAVHQVNLARIDPQRNSPLDITRDGEVIEACPPDDEDADCIAYAGFTATADGLMTHFTIDGSPLRDRVSFGTGSEVTAGPMAISIVTSYLSVSDRLFVVYTVRNDGAAPISATDVRYLSAAGQRVDPDNDTFRDPVEPGTFTIAAAAFPTTERGGTLAIDATSDESGRFQAAITVP